MTLYIATYLDSLSPCPLSYDVLALLDLAFNVNADLQKYFQKMTTRSYSCWLLLFSFLSRIKMIAKLFWLKNLCWEWLKQINCLYLLHDYFDLGNSRKCSLVLLLSFAISISHVVSKWLQNYFVWRINAGNEKKINLSLSPPLLLWLGELWAEDSN